MRGAHKNTSRPSRSFGLTSRRENPRLFGKLRLSLKHTASKFVEEAGDETDGILEMLLAKKKAPERRLWLETKGDLAVAE
jgi:hypothetical protein